MGEIPEGTAHDLVAMLIFSVKTTYAYGKELIVGEPMVWDENNVTCQFDSDQMRLGPFSVV